MSQLRDRIGRAEGGCAPEEIQIANSVRYQIFLYRRRGQSKLLTMLLEQATCVRDLCADKSSGWDASIQFRELSIQSTKAPTTAIDCETFTSCLGHLINRDTQVRSPIAENVSSPAYTCPFCNLLLRHLSSQHRSTPDSQPAPPTPSIDSHRVLTPKSHIPNRPPQMHKTPHLRSRNPSPFRKLQGSHQFPPLNPRPRLFPHRLHG